MTELLHSPRISFVNQIMAIARGSRGDFISIKHFSCKLFMHVLILLFYCCTAHIYWVIVQLSASSARIHSGQPCHYYPFTLSIRGWCSSDFTFKTQDEKKEWKRRDENSKNCLRVPPRIVSSSCCWLLRFYFFCVLSKFTHEMLGLRKAKRISTKTKKTTKHKTY